MTFDLTLGNCEIWLLPACQEHEVLVEPQWPTLAPAVLFDASKSWRCTLQDKTSLCHDPVVCSTSLATMATIIENKKIDSHFFWLDNHEHVASNDLCLTNQQDLNSTAQCWHKNEMTQHFLASCYKFKILNVLYDGAFRATTTCWDHMQNNWSYAPKNLHPCTSCILSCTTKNQVQSFLQCNVEEILVYLCNMLAITLRKPFHTMCNQIASRNQNFFFDWPHFLDTNQTW